MFFTDLFRITISYIEPSVLYAVGWAAERASNLQKNSGGVLEWLYMYVWSKVQTCIIAQMMPLPLTVSYFCKTRMALPFWYWLTWVVPEKGP